MKTNRITRRLATGILASAASFLWLAGSAHAQPSPAGDWDIKIAGQNLGTAQITFSQEFDFEAGGFRLAGYQISTIHRLKPQGINSRTGLPEGVENVTDSRTGAITPDGTVITALEPKVSGESLIDGVWYFDTAGRLIGSYKEITTIPEGGTNRVVITPYSFRGSVKPGRSLSLRAQGPSGNLTLQGRPTIPLLDLSGSYYGQSKSGGVSYLEFFDLSPTGNPNIYDVTGTGPNYRYSGTAMYVRQGSFSMVTKTEGTNEVVRSVTGGLRTATPPPHGTLIGQQTGVEANVQFRINP